jgi:hypothetical protein
MQALSGDKRDHQNPAKSFRSQDPMSSTHE